MQITLTVLKRQVMANLVTWYKLMFAVFRKRDLKSLYYHSRSHSKNCRLLQLSHCKLGTLNTVEGRNVQ